MTITEEFDKIVQEELAKYPITDDMSIEEVIDMGILHIEIVELIGKALIRGEFDELYRQRRNAK